ncbi:methyltransferase [Actibacterium sp. 188UL27-1]|uniref:methyltransferase n=1 Tax=Actibacterium sp. 188UL27-1 TaxID=2786961 RepID=UPI0019591FD0|nr:methyltransferase [Actibacterium sp. 188UL27-1]MBM7070022.1 methyltransferase domain-containing protein [Actibacterium sp. 188UL27-1]
MTDTAGKAGLTPPYGPGWRARWRRWRNRKVADPAFQSWASGFALTRGVARRDGAQLFDLVAGFVHSQVLFALVELDLLAALQDTPVKADALALRHGVDSQRMTALLQAGVALGLLERVGDGYQTARLGAAALGVPGLAGMIRHHDVLYRDLTDPLALLRGEGQTALARFWPYVFGATGASDPDTVARYSALMAESQALVAEETLRAVSFDKMRHLMDVGGGTGAFLAAVGRAVPGLDLTLFDLPAVVAGAEQRFASAGLADRVSIHAGSFRDDPLPEGADAISLVRVLYDHADDTVATLLRAVHGALPPGGQVVVSEPMTGGATPHRAGDAYFAFYCMAMQTGRARSPGEIAGLLGQAGFVDVAHRPTHRPFVTSTVTAFRQL